MTVHIYYYTDAMQLLVEKETQLAEKKDLESELVSKKPSILIYLHLLPHFCCCFWVCLRIRCRVR